MSGIISHITAAPAAELSAWMHSMTVRTGNGGGDGPSLDFDDGQVDPDVKRSVDDAVTTVLYVVAGFFLLLALMLIGQAARGKKDLGGRIALCFIAMFAALSPTEFGQTIFGVVQNLFT